MDEEERKQLLEEELLAQSLAAQAHDLIPQTLREEIPQLYAAQQENDPLLRVKFFTPWSCWTWYVIEFDGTDICFGFVEGFEAELGYFSLLELEAIRGPGGLRIERDLYFDPVPLSAIRKK